MSMEIKKSDLMGPNGVRLKKTVTLGNLLACREAIVGYVNLIDKNGLSIFNGRESYNISKNHKTIVKEVTECYNERNKICQRHGVIENGRMIERLDPSDPNYRQDIEDKFRAADKEWQDMTLAPIEFEFVVYHIDRLADAMVTPAEINIFLNLGLFAEDEDCIVEE